MEYIPIRIGDLLRQLNRDIYLPAIQREFVWDPQRIERLFDSIMCHFPIGSFLFWKVDQSKKDEWPVYRFISDFDKEDPHNEEANMAGVTKDITLVLDGQQRITSLLIGLKGTYSYFYYRTRKTTLYLNLLKVPKQNDDDPEELTYEFKFRETSQPDPGKRQLWFKVGRILDYPGDAEDAKSALKQELSALSEDERENANRLIGGLHNRIFTTTVGNYYEERSQDYDKVLQVFVRANAGGQPLEYSDLLLATATAKWETYDARKEIHDFTDEINDIGSGYTFGKDFVLKASLYLCETLPIQYRVKNFNRSNLLVIERTWPDIKAALRTTVRLISKFGFHHKNIVAPLALLPIAFFLLKRRNSSFELSSESGDATQQVAIRRWFIFATLKNAFGASSDTVLQRLRDDLLTGGSKDFPAEKMYASLGIQAKFSPEEIDRILSFQYQGRYTNLVLSLLYPGNDWKAASFHEDHIFPQSDFLVRQLRQRGYNDERINRYQSLFNLLPNLELLTDAENLSKNATPFDVWLKSRDASFKSRHLVPDAESYGFDSFIDFWTKRRQLIREKLSQI
jgi:hypothetical protein